ncbi:restriction endonuclease [Lacunimicrobium album]
MQRLFNLTDILAFLQWEIELTRGTLVEILKELVRLVEFKINPQAFMTESLKLIDRTLNELVIDRINYEKLEGQVYEMRLFEEKEVEEYMSRSNELQINYDRTPYDFIPFDSGVEKGIAEKLDSSEAVKFFSKLSGWFKIATPLGNYNPDWAVVLERDTKLYLVRETRDTHDRDKRRDIENRKIDCGRAHFDALGVDYEVATNVQEVLTPRAK